MNITTNYGICKNVDIDHMQEYLGGIGTDTDCFMFSDLIVNPKPGVYLLFGFEVWKDKENEFHFFVEEGYEDGSSETRDAGIDKASQEYIKKLYYQYLLNKQIYKIEEDEFGYIVTNKNGEIIVMTDSKEDAEYFVKSYGKADTKKIDAYKQFDNYTKKLKGKCYIEGKIATPFETPLMRFVQSFEKKGFKVDVDYRCLGGENFFIVDNVEYN